MGWHFKKASYFCENGKINKKAEINAHIDYMKACGKGLIFLRIRIVRDVAYLAISDGEGVYANVVYFYFDDGRGLVGTKTECEADEPVAQECPADILDILTPDDRAAVTEWREACRENLRTGAQAMRKKQFFICAKDADGRKGAHATNGYVTTIAGRGFGFHNRGGEWTATDLYSGLMVTAQKTRKAAVDYCILAMRRDDVRRVLEGEQELTLDYVF